MRVLVLGATGATGREVVTQALWQGHDVTALVRNPEKRSWPNIAASSIRLSSNTSPVTTRIDLRVRAAPMRAGITIVIGAVAPKNIPGNILCILSDGGLRDDEDRADGPLIEFLCE